MNFHTTLFSVRYLNTSGNWVICLTSLTDDQNVVALSDIIVAGKPRLAVKH